MDESTSALPVAGSRPAASGRRDLGNFGCECALLGAVAFLSVEPKLRGVRSRVSGGLAPGTQGGAAGSRL